MVVPAEAPTFTGWTARANATVSVRASTGEVAKAASGADRAFKLVLPAREASLSAFAVNISESGGATITLSNLLAGDVWLCSGQSNMEFSVAEMFGADELMAEAGREPGLRLFAVEKNASAQPRDDIAEAQYEAGWVEASPATVCGAAHGRSRADFCEPHCGASAAVASFKRDTWGYFSAACYVHGLQLLRETKRPQGLLESCWGGTPIEAWSSPTALGRCNSTARGPPEPSSVDAAEAAAGGGVATAPSSLWNGMIVPLLQLPIKGALWYQGEANARRGNLYACQLPAMIRDWRAHFAPLPSAGGPASAAVPLAFTTVQIAPAGGDGTLRLAQEASLSLPRTAMAVTVDLYDGASPCGAVHTRHKNETGRRAALASLAAAYGRTAPPWAGPRVAALYRSRSAAHLVAIEFDAAGGLAFASVPAQTTAPHDQSFEVTADATLANGWVAAPAALVGGSSVRVNASGLAGLVAGVRYAWANVPRGEQLYDGGGRAAGLPAAPFLALCLAEKPACTLIRGGDVPAADESVVEQTDE